jgi:hypothetical protein
MPELFDLLDIGALRLDQSPAAQVFTNGSTEKITVFDQVLRNGVYLTPSVANSEITIGKDGLYRVVIGLNVAYPGTEEIAIYGAVDDVTLAEYISVQGQGNGKPVSLPWVTWYPFTAGQRVSLYATNNDAGSVNASFLNAVMGLEFAGDLTEP